jgi:hypothetical protein
MSDERYRHDFSLWATWRAAIGGLFGLGWVLLDVQPGSAASIAATILAGASAGVAIGLLALAARSDSSFWSDPSVIVTSAIVAAVVVALIRIAILLTFPFGPIAIVAALFIHVTVRWINYRDDPRFARRPPDTP